MIFLPHRVILVGLSYVTSWLLALFPLTATIAVNIQLSQTSIQIYHNHFLGSQIFSRKENANGEKYFKWCYGCIVRLLGKWYVSCVNCLNSAISKIKGPLKNCWWLFSVSSLQIDQCHSSFEVHKLVSCMKKVKGGFPVVRWLYYRSTDKSESS